MKERLWLQIMSDFVRNIDSLQEDLLRVAEALDEHCKNVRIARIVGSSVAVAGLGQFPSSLTTPPHSSLCHATERELSLIHI